MRKGGIYEKKRVYREGHQDTSIKIQKKKKTRRTLREESEQ